MKFDRLFLVIGWIILVSVFIRPCGVPALANSPVKIVVVPFKIHSEKDLSFLQNGIQNMLATRLTRDERIKLNNRAEVEKAIADFPEPLTKQNAHLLGQKLFSDYVVFGSLTVFGNSVSTDAVLIDVTTKEPVVTFNQSGESRGDVIPHVNMFSQQIREKLFGPVPATDEKPAVSQAMTPVRPDAGKPEPDFFKSRRMNMEMMSLAMGDVDGDGRVELVFLSPHDVFIYRYTAGRFVKVSEINEKSYNQFIRVDIGDINGNGKAEMFITNLSRTGSTLNSLVMEWDGTDYRKIVTRQNLFYRVIRTPEQGDRLLGQKYNTKKVFEKGIHELIWNGEVYDTDRPYGPALNKNIYEFSYGDLLHKGRQIMASFSSTDRIRVMNPDGGLAWESADPYGGNYTYIAYHDEIDKDDEERYYLPQRIFVTDFDNNGKADFVVVKNKDTSSRVFGRFRMFRLGYLECLTWQGLGFEPLWRTPQISGYICDYGIGDIDGDGRKELVCGVVEQKDALIAKSRSYFIVWNKISRRILDNAAEEAFGKD